MKPLIGVPGHGFSSHHCAATCEPELASADMCCEKVQNYMSPLRSFESIQIKYTYMELIYQIYLYVESIFGCNGVTGGSSEEYNFLRWSEYIQVKSEKLHFCPFHKTKTWNKVFCIWTILHSTQLATVWGSTQVSAAGAGLSATMAWRRCVCECGDADLGWQKQKINHSPLRRLIWFETKNILLWVDCFDLRHQLQDLLWGGSKPQTAAAAQTFCSGRCSSSRWRWSQRDPVHGPTIILLDMLHTWSCIWHLSHATFSRRAFSQIGCYPAGARAQNWLP